MPGKEAREQNFFRNSEYLRGARSSPKSSKGLLGGRYPQSPLFYSPGIQIFRQEIIGIVFNFSLQCSAMHAFFLRFLLLEMDGKISALPDGENWFIFMQMSVLNPSVFIRTNLWISHSN